MSWEDHKSLTDSTERLLRCGVVGTGGRPILARNDKRKIDGTWLTKLTADLEYARALTGHATGRHTNKEVARADEGDLEDALTGGIRCVQAAAEERYSIENKPTLPGHCFAEHIKSPNRPDLACATNIQAKAKDAALPCTQAEEPKVTDQAFEVCEGVEGDQSGERSGTPGPRTVPEILKSEIVNQRHEPHLALDSLQHDGARCYPRRVKAPIAERVPGMR